MSVIPLLAAVTAVLAVLGTGTLVVGMFHAARAEEGTVEFQHHRGTIWRSSGTLLIVAAATAILVSGATWEEFPPLTPIMASLGVFSIYRGGQIRRTPPANPRISQHNTPPPLPRIPSEGTGLPDLGLALRPSKPRLPRRGGRR